MKSIIDYINENINITEGTHEAEEVAYKALKGIVNKKMSLDELSELLADDGWEFCEEVPAEKDKKDMLVFVCNFTNNAEGDDDYLDIEVEKHGDMYKILSFCVE